MARHRGAVEEALIKMLDVLGDILFFLPSPSTSLLLMNLKGIHNSSCRSYAGHWGIITKPIIAPTSWALTLCHVLFYGHCIYLTHLIFTQSYEEGPYPHFTGEETDAQRP